MADYKRSFRQLEENRDSVTYFNLSNGQLSQFMKSLDWGKLIRYDYQQGIAGWRQQLVIKSVFLQ